MFPSPKTDSMKYVNSNGVFSTEEVKFFSGRKMLNLSFFTDTLRCLCVYMYIQRLRQLTEHCKNTGPEFLSLFYIER